MLRRKLRAFPRWVGALPLRIRGAVRMGSPTRARFRASLSKAPLPPGELLRLDELETADRHFLLRHAERVGPIFKAVWMQDFWICIMGIPRGRRFIKECGDSIRPMTFRLDRFFPKGFLRQMQGEEHRHYRRALSRAIRPADMTAALPDLRRIVRDALEAHLAAHGDHVAPAAAWIATINAIASGELIRVFFGARPGSADFQRLMEGYRRLGPDGLVWQFGPEQDAAFAGLRSHLLEMAGRKDGGVAGESILGRILQDGSLDDTLLGNLIYMVETGRYDTYSMFRWLTKYVADHPGFADRIRGEAVAGDEGGPFTEAFVLETLRTDQSERLMRRVERDVVFDGYLFPAGTTVRICMWEAHKSPESFPEPFQFNPERFLARELGPDEFSPFGLDQHQCPLGDVAIRAGRVFLAGLCRGYRVHPTGDGLPVRGMFHWEPASEFSVRLERTSGGRETADDADGRG